MSTTIGIDIGGTKVLAIRQTDGTVVARIQVAKPADGLLSPSVFDAVHGLWTDDVAAVGAGVAGLVRDGTFVWGPHVAGEAIPIRDRLEEAFGVPAAVDNDANAAAYGELHAGAAIGRRDVLLVTIGTGIGGAVIIDGDVYRGASGFAGEWGHVVVHPAGRTCACGNRGCWETLVSGPALARSDPATVGRALGEGLCGLVSIFDPELIVIGGGVSALGDMLLDPAHATLAGSLHGRPMRTPPPIVAAALGPAANAVGIALMAAQMVS